MPWPKVKTGPTKGEDRSRNKNGRIRAKRNDSGKKKKVTSPAFTDAEFLEWAKSKPQNETFDGIDNYTCVVAQFLYDTDRASHPFVLSEEWYDEALLTKKGKPSVVHQIPKKTAKAAISISPVNTFRHVAVRLKLLLEKRDMNDYYFEMRSS